MTWSLTYADGAANGDAISPTSFTYTPVTPEQSSTGMYSGGPPRAGSLAPEIAARILAAAEALAADTANHVEDRGKGTGAFTLTTGRGSQHFIVVRGPALVSFDALLASLPDGPA